MDIKKSIKKLIYIFTLSIALLVVYGISNMSIAVAANVKNGWVQSKGIWYYYQNDVMVKNGWAKDSRGWCFLNAIDGSWVQQGWAKDSRGWGYIQNGYWVEHEAWVRDSRGWCYMGKDGYWIDHKYYVYDSKGICIIGQDGYWTEERLPEGSVMPVAYIRLNKTSSNIYIGNTETLTAVVEPYNAENKVISWGSSNQSVATVDNTGKVTGVSVGTAIITAANTDGSVIAKATYTVSEVPNLTLDQIAENKDSIVSILAYDKSMITSVAIVPGTAPLPYAIGSGTVISEDGKLLTNYHLIEGAYVIFAVTGDGKVYEVEGILGYDKTKDIAVIKLKNAVNMKASIIGDSDTLNLNDKVVTIGHSLEADTPEANVLEGALSGIDESITTLRTGKDIKLTSIADQGYAGGGVYNLKGKLVGINYGVNNGSSFAIPINEYKSLINSTTIISIVEAYTLYKAEVPKIDEIKTINGIENNQIINFNPYFYGVAREITLSNNLIYSGDEAKTIIKNESTLNSDPGIDKQWILMNIEMTNNDESGVDLRPYEVVLDNFFMKDGTPLPIYEVAAFEGERRGNNITDIFLGPKENANFWIGVLLNKSEELPLLRIATGYNPDTLQRTYSWYSLK